MPTVIATPGAANANSYLTRTEGDTYYNERLFATIWTGAGDDKKDAALIMATRVMDAMMLPYKYFVSPTAGVNAVGGYFRTRPTWTGARVDDVQALAWPRSGMYNRNGVAIATTVIPQELKNATAELAGQLIRADRTLDNDVAVQGITDIKAGPVSLTFSGTAMTSKVLPDAVVYLLVPSWLTAESIEYAPTALFSVI